jgi:hypothetical protein
MPQLQDQLRALILLFITIMHGTRWYEIKEKHIKEFDGIL